MAAESLGELLLVLDADNSMLVAELNKSERKVQSSAAKMTKSINKAGSATASAGTSAQKAGVGFDILGTAAAATGFSFLGQAQALGELGSKLKSILPLIGKAGLVGGLIALGAAFVALAFDIGGARTALFDWIAGVGEAKKKAKELDEILKDAAKTREKRTQTLAAQLMEEEIARRNLTGTAAERFRITRGGAPEKAPQFLSELEQSKLRMLGIQDQRLQQDKTFELFKQTVELRKQNAEREKAIKLGREQFQMEAKGVGKFEAGLLALNLQTAANKQLLKDAREALQRGTATEKQVAAILGGVLPPEADIVRRQRAAGAVTASQVGESLARAGGSLGMQQNEIVKIEKSQLTVLQRIEKNTAKNNGGNGGLNL